MKTYVLSEDGRSEVEVPETCACGHGPEGHDCSLCIVCGLKETEGMLREAIREELREERIARLRGLVRDAASRRRDADLVLAARLGELAEAEGDASEAEFQRAYVKAQAGGHEEHERFMDLSAKQKAQSILAGKETLDDFSSWERPRIERFVEQLKGSVPA